MANRKKNDPEITQYTLKSGQKYWKLKTYVGINPETGKRVFVTRSKLKSRKEAENLRVQVKAQGAEVISTKINLNKENPTVNDIYKQWKVVAFQDIRESTIKNTVEKWESRIKPYFGKSRINKISPAKLQKWVNNLATELVSYRQVISILRRIINYAKFLGLVAKDPFDRVIIPKKTKKITTRPKNNFYERSELEEFLGYAKNYDFKKYVFFMVLANAGTRRGEALALTWKDLDFKNNQISLTKTVAMSLSRSPVINPIKNGLSHVVPMSKSLKETLLEYKELQESLGDNNPLLFHTNNPVPSRNPENQFLIRTQAAEDWIHEIYNFSDKQVQKWNKDHPDNKKKPLRRITPHGFRHTLATLLYEGNPNIRPKDVQFMLGHKSVNTALDIYTHITNKQKENIHDSLNNLDI